MLSDYQVLGAFFLITMVTGLFTISYWAGVSEIEEFAEDDDFY